MSSPFAQYDINVDRIHDDDSRVEDRAFLIDQQGARKMELGEPDIDYMEASQIQVDNKLKKKQNNQNTKPKRKIQQETQSDEEDDEMEEGETAEDHGEKVDKDFVVNKKKKKSEDTVTVQFPKKILDNPDLISMLDRTKTTPNAGLGVVAALLQTGKVVGEHGKENVDLNKFTLSYCSLKRSAKKNRKSYCRQDF